MQPPDGSPDPGGPGRGGSSRRGALTGARCPACPVTTYPAQPYCPRCGTPLRELALSPAGRLWTWTVQRHQPKSPPYLPPEAGFAPFAVGYVELADGVRVAAVLDVPLDELAIGLPVRIGPGPGVPRAVTDTDRPATGAASAPDAPVSGTPGALDAPVSGANR
ncbi:MAG TPA: OB-fold domain-containing protein [Mycobacteriales bacterium]|nr:OB-fold domain-containing protein [Mycobacteriales bacterium]